MKCPHCQHEISKQKKPIMIEYNGRQMSLRELARVSGIAFTTLQNRYEKGLRGEQLLNAVDLRFRPKRIKQEQPLSEISGLMRLFLAGAPR